MQAKAKFAAATYTQVQGSIEIEKNLKINAIKRINAINAIKRINAIEFN